MVFQYTEDSIRCSDSYDVPTRRLKFSRREVVRLEDALLGLPVTIRHVVFVPPLDEHKSYGKADRAYFRKALPRLVTKGVLRFRMDEIAN